MDLDASEPSRPPRAIVAAWWAAIAAALLINEWPLLRQDPVLSRDDARLIDPLRQVHGLADYLAMFQRHRILDLQPLRDLSLWLDVRIHDATGISTFHITNLVLLFLILGALQQVLVCVFGARPMIGAWLALFALHPVVSNTVSWIAARKHLLAALFILAATWQLLRERRVLAGALYLASVLAQPITVLWPAWVAIEVGSRKGLRAGVRSAAVYLPITIAALVANYLYYTGPFVQQTGAEKFVAVEGSERIVPLLALGRDLFNALCPVAIATSYDPSRIFNLIGLLALPLVIFATLKLANPRLALSGWTLFFFPLVPVTARITNIFVSDTYLLVPLAGLAWVGAAVWSAVPPRRAVQLAGLGAALVASGVMARASGAIARSWLSEAALWDHAFHTEPTPNVLAKEAFYLTSNGHADDAIPVAMWLASWQPGHPEAAFVLARAIYASTLTPEQKLDKLQHAPARDAWTDYFIAVLEVSLGRYRESLDAWRAVSTHASRLGASAAVAAAEARFACLRAQAQGCDDLVQAFRESATPSGWDAGAFQRRAAQLGLPRASGD